MPNGDEKNKKGKKERYIARSMKKELLGQMRKEMDIMDIMDVCE